jgi:uncharacterized membrane protein
MPLFHFVSSITFLNVAAESFSVTCGYIMKKHKRSPCSLSSLKSHALTTRSFITFKQLRMLVIVLILNVPALDFAITTVAMAVAMALFACAQHIIACARGTNHGLVTAGDSSYPWKCEGLVQH